MPAAISTTIAGTCGTGSRSISSGASMAAATTISRFSYSSPWIVPPSHSLVGALRRFRRGVPAGDRGVGPGNAFPHPAGLHLLVRLHPHERAHDPRGGELVAGERADQERYPLHHLVWGILAVLVSRLHRAGIRAREPVAGDRGDLLRHRHGPHDGRVRPVAEPGGRLLDGEGPAVDRRRDRDHRLLAITLLGLQFWIDVLEADAGLRWAWAASELSSGESAAILVPLQIAGLCLAIVCFLKGKTLTGLVGLVRSRSWRSSGRCAGRGHPASLSACRAPRSPSRRRRGAVRRPPRHQPTPPRCGPNVPCPVASIPGDRSHRRSAPRWPRCT